MCSNNDACVQGNAKVSATPDAFLMVCSHRLSQNSGPWVPLKYQKGHSLPYLERIQTQITDHPKALWMAKELASNRNW